MVDNLAVKVDKCPLNRGSLCTVGTAKNCPLYGVAGCPLFRGCLSIEVNGRTVGTFSISWVSAVECLRGSNVVTTI